MRRRLRYSRNPGQTVVFPWRKERQKDLEEAHAERIDRALDTQGYAVVVEHSSAPGQALYAYSVGLRMHGEPELILPAHLDPADLTRILDQTCQAIITDGTQTHCPVLLTPSNQLVMLIPAWNHPDYPVQGVESYIDWPPEKLSTNLLCVVLADRSNRFPWDDGYAPQFWQIRMFRGEELSRPGRAVGAVG